MDPYANGWWSRFEHFANPVEQWSVLPSFMIGELLFVACAVAAFVHARSRGRSHLLVWWAALIAGTANDFIFMALPLVDNFWQAQATVMLTPRMPLYIPCVYVCFMYYPTVAARSLGLGRWPTAALGGLLALLFYAPYDIVGAKFLWWTWHDTDLPIATRILGAPCSSTLWVLTFVGAFNWLLDTSLRKDPEATERRTFWVGLAKVAGLTTLLMMVQITALQQLDGGAPGYAALGVGIALYAILVLRGSKTKADARPEVGATAAGSPPLLRGMLAGYFVTLASIALLFDPTTHVSTGLHQPTGPCYVEATDITGHTRHAFLCAHDFDEDFTFACTETPTGDRAWYTVCGRAHQNPAVWKGGVLLLCVTALAAFGLVLRRRREAD